MHRWKGFHRKRIFFFPLRICKLKNFRYDLRLIFVFYYSDHETFWLFFLRICRLKSSANICILLPLSSDYESFWQGWNEYFSVICDFFFSEYFSSRILDLWSEAPHIKKLETYFALFIFLHVRIVWLKEKLFCSSIKSFYFSCHGSRRFLSSR